MPRYKVPEARSGIFKELSLRADPEGRYPFKPAEESTDKSASEEYDYAESSLVLRSNMLKISATMPNEGARNKTENNAPYYHILETEERPRHGGPINGVYKVAEKTALHHPVPDEPNPSNSQDNSCRGSSEGAHYVAKEMDPYYHVLEASDSVDLKSDNQIGPKNEAHEEGACYYMVKGPTSSPQRPDENGYKELHSDGRVSTSYQALHKYTYVTVGGPPVNRHK